MNFKPKRFLYQTNLNLKPKRFLHQTNLYLLKPWKATRTTFSKAQYKKSLFFKKPLPETDL